MAIWAVNKKLDSGEISLVAKVPKSRVLIVVTFGEGINVICSENFIDENVVEVFIFAGFS